MPAPKGSKPHNKIDRTWQRYGKLLALKDEGNGRWLCKCDCGNDHSVLSTNLSGYARDNRGCLNCANRKNITGERRGLLIAVSVEQGPVKGHPLWTFKCDCGNEIQGTVREFNFNWLRSCGCHDSTFGSWTAMIKRCYRKEDIRYKHYGARGITVCKRWHNFDNFAADMGERPKRHTLSRNRCEEGYSPGNCIWEHITKNIADTHFGKPTKTGLTKGAKRRY